MPLEALPERAPILGDFAVVVVVDVVNFVA